jgi:hypothetical protein
VRLTLTLCYVIQLAAAVRCDVPESGSVLLIHKTKVCIRSRSTEQLRLNEIYIGRFLHTIIINNYATWLYCITHTQCSLHNLSRATKRVYPDINYFFALRNLKKNSSAKRKRVMFLMRIASINQSYIIFQL